MKKILLASLCLAVFSASSFADKAEVNQANAATPNPVESKSMDTKFDPRNPNKQQRTKKDSKPTRCPGCPPPFVSERQEVNPKEMPNDPKQHMPTGKVKITAPMTGATDDKLAPSTEDSLPHGCSTGYTYSGGGICTNAKGVRQSSF